MFSKSKFLLKIIVVIILNISLVWACDPTEKINRVNSATATKVIENFSSPNIFYGGWSYPRSVEVSNYDGDCFPWVSGNGRYLLFASINFNGPPRPNHQGNWDIYRSEWNDIDQCWDVPENISPNINTGLDERRPSCNFNCDTIYFHQVGLNHNANIYMSCWDGDSWTVAESLPSPINTPANEEHPAISPDGRRLYFTSDRPEGLGGKDIWVAVRNGPVWDTVLNLGPPINTRNEETRPFESFDGQRLYFTNQHAEPRQEGCYGGPGDIYVAFWTGSGWDNVSVVAAPVNNDLVACSPCESPDGRELYFGSEAWEGGRGDEDIWVAKKDTMFAPAPAHGYGNWLKTGELDNAIIVFDLAEGPGGVIYAATACADTAPMGKVFKTTNSGITWIPCGDLPGSMTVYSLLMVEDTIYAGTYPNGDVYKSINEGNSWINTTNLHGVTSVRGMTQLQNGDILVGTAPHDIMLHNRIFRSTDGGMLWDEAASLFGMNPVKFINQISNGTIFAGGWGMDSCIIIHRSTDNGMTWEKITVVPHEECDWSSNALFEASDSTLYVMGWYPAREPGWGGGYVCKSFDNGTTWDSCAKIMRGDGVHNGQVYDMIEDLSGILYVGMQPAYDSVVFATSDGGESWFSTGGLDGAFECLCLLRTSDGSIYAGTSPNGDVFKYTAVTIQEDSKSIYSNELKILPNPTRNTFTISSGLLKNPKTQLKIYNALGNLIKEIKPMRKEEITVSIEEKGIIFIILGFEDKTIKKKVTITD